MAGQQSLKLYSLSAQHFEGFDPEGFSIWFCDYKYPEENTVNFIVMNKACPPFCPPAVSAHCMHYLQNMF